MWDVIHVIISVMVVFLAWILLSRDLSGWRYSRRVLLMAIVLAGATTISVLNSGWGPLAMFVGAGIIGGYLSMSYYGNNQSSPHSLLSILVIVCGFSILSFSFGLVITDSDSEIPTLNYFFIAMCQFITMMSISGGMVLFGRAEDMELKKSVATKGGRWKWLVAGLAVVAAALIVLMAFLPVKSPIFLTNALISWLIGWVLFSSVNMEENETSTLAPLLTGLLGLSVALLGVAAADRIITVIGGMTAGMCLRAFWMEDSSLGSKLQRMFAPSTSGAIAVSEAKQNSDDESENENTKRKLPKNVQGITSEEAATRIIKSHRVMIIPGAGFEAVDAKEEFQVLLESLEKSNVQYQIGIHPQAGRTQGALESIVKTYLKEREPSNNSKSDIVVITTVEDIQKAALEAHLVLAFGANDVINPDLKSDNKKTDDSASVTSLAVESEPELETEETSKLNEPESESSEAFQPIDLLNGPPAIVLKRSLDNGLADKRNPLFAASNCFLLLDDIPQSIFEIDTALRARLNQNSTNDDN